MFALISSHPQPFRLYNSLYYSKIHPHIFKVINITKMSHLVSETLKQFLRFQIKLFGNTFVEARDEFCIKVT